MRSLKNVVITVIRWTAVLNGKTPRRLMPVAARVFQRLKRVLLDLPVAMLELLARTAIAQLVTAQLLLVANRCDGEGDIDFLTQLFHVFKARCFFVVELHACSQRFGFLT